MDMISKLPVGIIETILCLLPIQEAARTSILSKEWRYHWSKIPKLVFIENQFQVATEPEQTPLEQSLNKPSKRLDMHKRCQFFYAIYQVLLIHQGPIHEFTLSMYVDDSCVEIDHIILHLSKLNSVKMLKLDFSAGGDRGYVLPKSLFSLNQLTSLYLDECALYQERSFNEFCCITTLHMESVWAYAKPLLRLLSSCPILKKLTLDCECSAMFACEYAIVDLFECLPVIEYLHVRFFILECFPTEPLPKELPTALVHLKSLCMDRFCFSHIDGLPFLALLIRSSPNLEKLKLVMYTEDELEEDETGTFSVEDYSDIMLEHLNEFEIRDFSDAENELDFVKFILAKSPVLKKVSIFTNWPCHFDDDEKIQILQDLCLSTCESEVVKITVS